MKPLQILSKEMNGWYKGKITLPNKTEKVGLIAGRASIGMKFLLRSKFHKTS